MRTGDSHIRKLLTVDGYDTLQCFDAVTTNAAPFLAIHDVNGPEVFQTSGYRSAGGSSDNGEWRVAISYWSGNFFDGRVSMPAVGNDERLVAIDDPIVLSAVLAHV